MKIFDYEIKISKSLLGAIIFAISLWGYASLNEVYVTKLYVPVEIKLPNNIALEAEHIKKISLEVKGNGWQLFNLLYFNQSKRCLIDLENTVIENNSYLIDRNKILKSVVFTNLETRDVIPNNFEIKTGLIGEKIIDIIPSFELIFQEGYTLKDKAIIKPTKIKIKGNRKIISKINSWRTEKREFTNINSQFYKKIHLFDTLKNVVDLSAYEVEIIAEIEPISSVIFYNLSLEIMGGKLNDNRLLSNDKFNVVVSGPISKIENLDISDISISLDYSEIISNNNLILIPKVKLPNGIVLNKLTPNYIYSYKITKDLTIN